jgi:hypothetical protein
MGEVLPRCGRFLTEVFPRIASKGVNFAKAHSLQNPSATDQGSWVHRVGRLIGGFIVHSTGKTNRQYNPAKRFIIPRYDAPNHYRKSADGRWPRLRRAFVYLVRCRWFQ